MGYTLKTIFQKLQIPLCTDESTVVIKHSHCLNGGLTIFHHGST